MLDTLSIIDYPIKYALWILAGSAYGMIIGIIPSVRATTGLLAVFSLLFRSYSNPCATNKTCLRDSTIIEVRPATDSWQYGVTAGWRYAEE